VTGEAARSGRIGENDLLGSITKTAEEVDKSKAARIWATLHCPPRQVLLRCVAM